MSKHRDVAKIQSNKAVADLTEHPPHRIVLPSASNAARKKRGKSVSPDYVKLTSYILRETHRAVKRRLLDEGKEISVLVQELLAKWLG